MKKLILAALVLTASVANAAEVKIFEANLSASRGYSTDVDARFYMDTETLEGFVTVNVTEEILSHRAGFPAPGCRGYCFPYPNDTFRYITILNDSVRVEGLMLMGDKVTYHAAEGDVDCGTLGTSRVLRRPTIYLSGNCEITDKIVHTEEGRKLVLTLKTK